MRRCWDACRPRSWPSKRRANATAADACYPGTRCTPGKGRNASGCDFAFSTVFHDKDVRGSNLSDSSFVGAQLAGADLRGANPRGGCFVDANLLDAKLGASVNLHSAVFCRTLNETIARRLNLIWGTRGTVVPLEKDPDHLFTIAGKTFIEEGLATEGEFALIAGSLPMTHTAGRTNMLHVRRLGT